MEGPACRAPRLYRPMMFPARLLAVAALACAIVLVPVASTPLAGEAASADTAIGARDAPVTIVEYFSFSCSHCARFHREAFPKLKRDYIDTGKLRFVFRDFPLNLPALNAARLAHCAGPERYVEIVDLFRRRWDDWIDEPDPTGALLGQLRELGLGESTLERCEHDPSLEKQVLESYLEGSRDHGVDRTPTFLVNGRKYVGLVSYGRWVAILDTPLE